MRRMRWHILRDDGVFILARHLPVRFDIAAETTLPLVPPLRLAHQIRQDLWRSLQHVRGFSPVVSLRKSGDHWHVRTGGRVAGAAPHSLTVRIEDLLNTPHLRERWVRYANAKRPSII